MREEASKGGEGVGVEVAICNTAEDTFGYFSPHHTVAGLKLVLQVYVWHIRKIPLSGRYLFCKQTLTAFFPVFDRPYTVLIKNEEDAASEGVINIFTDGSKRKESTGCGIYFRSLHIRYQWAMNGRATVIQAELAGITIATKEIARRQIMGKSIRIYTDSRQSILILHSRNIMSRSVWECHQTLVVASNTNIISVCWVKGHDRCNGNKKTDKLARRKSDLTIFGHGPSSVLSLSTLFEMIKENTHKEFRTRWDEINSLRFAKEFLGYLADTAKKYLAMVRVSLPGEAYSDRTLLAKERSSEQEDATVFHVLSECTGGSSTRESVLGWPSMASIREIPPSNVITFFSLVG
ncbi:uncharacterized protein LOC108917621 [Anoplophora glabripennis]|uniref:uncharacterized protein LOC108917621 n=1 Tax=Anoplophora glabripennis TaxID=217634 RepID=UPI000875296C|nr:uncharacterized protein LOC108917621 [Anoplophora glabripennis]